MALPATDTFTTATDQNLDVYSSNWTDNGDAFDVQASTDTVLSTSGDYRVAWWNADTFDNDQYSEAEVSALGSGAYMGVAVRASGAAGSEDAYVTYTDSGTCYLEKIVGGTVTELSSTSGPSTGQVLRIEAEGSTITVKYDGSTTGAPSSTTDSSITSGSAGLAVAFSSASTRFDNWEGGNISSGPQTVEVAGTVARSLGVTGDGEGGTVINDLAFGDLFIYREATGLDGDVNTPGDTYDHIFDTNVSVPHSDGPSFSGADITLPAGQWVVVYSTQYEANGGTNRTELNTFFREDSADTPWGWSQGFIRRSSGADECIMTGSALLDASGSNVFTLRTINQQGPNGDGTTRGTRRSANGTQIAFLYLGNNSLDWIRAYQNTDTGAQSLDSQTWTDITMNTTDGSNGSAFSHSSGTITWSGTAGQFAMFGGNVANTREESSTRLALAARFAVGGTGRGQDTSYCYSRGDQSSEDLRDGVTALAAIIEKVSASEDITIEMQRIESTAVTSTVRAEGTSFWAIQLPDDSELVLVSGGTGNINGNATVSLSTPDEIGTNFTNNTTNIATDVSMSLLILGQFYSTDAVTRSYPRAEIRENGSYANAGLGGAYNRNQANQATTVGDMYAGAIASTAVDDEISIYGTPLAATGAQNLSSFSLYILRTDTLTAPSSGTTYEDSATIGKSIGVSGVADLIAEDSATLAKNLGVSSDVIGTYGVEALIAISRSIGADEFAVFEEAVSLDRSAGVSALSGLSIQETVTIGKNLGLTADEQAIVEAAAIVGSQRGVSALVTSVLAVAVTLGRSVGISPADELILELAANLGVSRGVSGTAGSIFFASGVIGRTAAVSAQSILDLVVSGTIGRASSVSIQTNVDFNVSATISAQFGTSDEVTGILGAAATVAALRDALAASDLNAQDAATISRSLDIAGAVLVSASGDALATIQKLVGITAASGGDFGLDAQIERNQALVAAANAIMEVGATLGVSLGLDVSTIIALSVAGQISRNLGIAASAEVPGISVSATIQSSLGILGESELIRAVAASIGLALGVGATSEAILDVGSSVGIQFGVSGSANVLIAEIETVPRRTVISRRNTTHTAKPRTSVRRGGDGRTVRRPDA